MCTNVLRVGNNVAFELVEVRLAISYTGCFVVHEWQKVV